MKVMGGGEPLGSESGCWVLKGWADTRAPAVCVPRSASCRFSWERGLITPQVAAFKAPCAATDSLHH